MKVLNKFLLPTLLLVLSTFSILHAQRGDNYAKLGATAFFLSDGREINHTFLSLGASYEHQFSGQFSVNVNANAARLVSDAKADPIDGYIRYINSAEMELRFYPNKKGKGFYAGASAAYYWDKTEGGVVSKKSNHLGSHINVGVQVPMHQDFYLQANGQIGIYGKGYSTISRYGINAMVGKRF